MLEDRLRCCRCLQQDMPVLWQVEHSEQDTVHTVEQAQKMEPVGIVDKAVAVVAVVVVACL